MLKKTFLLLLLILSAGCNKSGVKDYWKLNEPEVFAWDTSEDANRRGFSSKYKNFNSASIKENLDYKSYLQFNNLTSENKFIINTTCTDIKTSKTYTYNSDPNKENKRIAPPITQKLYFYNYLPTEVIHNQSFEDADSFFKCNFHFNISNAINSDYDIEINDIPINTNKSNIIQILSQEREKNTGLRTIISKNIHKDSLYPNIFYTNDTHSYVIENIQKNTQLIGPAVVECLGKNNTFPIESLDGSSLISLESIFFNFVKKNSNIPFLKKCRVLAKVRFPTNDNVMGNDGFSNELRNVWSEYFNIIFEEPKFNIEVTNIADTQTSDIYPYNNGDYLDKAFVLYGLKITNPTNKHVKIHLPSDKKIEGVISPIIYNIQREDFKIQETRFWPGLEYYELPEEFVTEIYFVKDGERVVEIDLKPNSSSSFSIEVNKNFYCMLKPHKHYFRLTSQQPTSERGFRLRSIDFNSPQNFLKVEYKNQNKVETFPYLLAFDKIIENSASNNNLLEDNSPKSKINYLQMTFDRTTAIDAVFLRSTNDLIFPVATKQNPWDLPHDITYHSMQHEVKQIKEHNTIPNKFEKLQTERQFCQQVY